MNYSLLSLFSRRRANVAVAMVAVAGSMMLPIAPVSASKTFDSATIAVDSAAAQSQDATVRLAVPVTPRRLGGSDRVDTSILISRDSFADRAASAVVLARSDLYPDAVAGAPLAVKTRGPLLLTDPGELESRVSAELARVVAPGATIYLLGGPVALRPEVENQVRAAGFRPVRLGGDNRFATAVAIAELGLGRPQTVFLATSQEFAYALLAGATASRVGGAVLLTSGAQLPPETSGYLARAGRGARYAVGAAAVAADESAWPIAGVDQYETSVLLARTFFNWPKRIGLASGQEFPDALSGGAHIASSDGALLLTRPASLPPAVEQYLLTQNARLSDVALYGGTVAVSDNVARSTGSSIARPSPVATSAERSVVDRPDDTDGFQIHPIYVIPSDGLDRRRDVNGEITRSLTTMNAWLGQQTGGRSLRMDTFGGQLDITFVMLPKSHASMSSVGVFIRDEIEAMLPAGLAQPNKLYPVYYEGGSSFSCGLGAFPPDLPGRIGVICSASLFGASSPSVPGYLEFGMLHEILHTLGIAAICAPNYYQAHVSDSPQDLMYAGSEPWVPSKLDVGRNDYFEANRPGCPDLARSSFLSPNPPAAELPPLWGTRPGYRSRL